MLEGTLIVSGSLSGTGAVSVSSGATLGGSGLIDGATTVNGTLNPGAGLTTGTTLTIDASVTFNNGSTFKVNIDPTNNVVDELTIGGGTARNLTLAAGDNLTFALVNGGSLSSLAPGTYVIANDITGGVLAGAGTFATDSTLQSNWSITYTTNEVELVVAAVPEPGTWAMLASGMGMLFVIQRARRRKV